MKKITIIILGIIMLSGCGMHQNLTNNTNNSITNVVLSGNNYKIVRQVKGSARTTSVFGFGGASKKDLIAKAREDMLRNIDMVGFPRAIINESVETHYGFFPFTRNYTVTISAYVIEFTDKQ